MPRKKTSPGKKHKGFYIYSRDLLSSQRYRRCSWATKGVYLDLLNVLAVQDHPGALCLRDFDLKPRGERSLTQRCLACQRKAKNGEYQSIKYFAEAIAISASGPRPGLIHGLQELYLRGIICIVGDTLIQPRMYRDSGIEVVDADGQPIDVGEGDGMTVVGSPDDGEADPDAEKIRLAGMAESSTENGVQKSTENSRPRVGAGDAPASANRVRVRVRDNNNNSKGNIGGVGDGDDGSVRTPKQGEADPTAFWPFWLLYDKKRVGAHWIPIGTVYQQWLSLSDDDRRAVMDFLPRYIEATPTKQWRMHPLNFLQQRAWLTIKLDGDRVLHPREDEAEKAAVAKTSAKSRPVVDNPPTQEEVTEYCREKGYTFDPIQFWNHYEANGWVQGRNKPIRKWQACCVTWQQHENNGEFRSHSNNSNAEATTRHTGNSAATARRAATSDGQHPTDDELREQSMRIIERKLRKDDGDTA